MREISIKLCPTSWFLFFWSRFCHRNHSKEEVKTEDVTRYESDATPEEIIERVPLRKQEFVLDRLVSNTDIVGTQDAVLMVSFVWRCLKLFFFFGVCHLFASLQWLWSNMKCILGRFAWKKTDPWHPILGLFDFPFPRQGQDIVISKDMIWMVFDGRVQTQ